MLSLAGSMFLLAAGGSGPCAAAQSSAIVSPPGEPGTPMIVRGQVFRPDGKTPAAGVTMYVYQTGADGLYHNDARGIPRLRAWLKTDNAGRYEYRTIRPAPYPQGRIEAHVHIQFWGSDVPPQYAEDLNFDDDSLVKPALRERSRALGRFGGVRSVEAREGVLHVQQDFRLKAGEDRFSDNIMHGRRACGAT